MARDKRLAFKPRRSFYALFTSCLATFVIFVVAVAMVCFGLLPFAGMDLGFDRGLGGFLERVLTYGFSVAIIGVAFMAIPLVKDLWNS